MQFGKKKNNHPNKKKMFGSDIPEPNKFVVTRWHQDPFARGAYAFIKSGASGDSKKKIKHDINVLCNMPFFYLYWMEL